MNMGFDVQNDNRDIFCIFIIVYQPLFKSVLMKTPLVSHNARSVRPYLQVNKGVTVVDLLSFARELEAQTDLMVRASPHKHHLCAAHSVSSVHSLHVGLAHLFIYNVTEALWWISMSSTRLWRPCQSQACSWFQD